MKLESNFLQVEVENVSMGAFEVVCFFFLSYVQSGRPQNTVKELL